MSGVEFFILGDCSSVAYRTTENLSRLIISCSTVVQLAFCVYFTSFHNSLHPLHLNDLPIMIVEAVELQKFKLGVNAFLFDVDGP